MLQDALFVVSSVAAIAAALGFLFAAFEFFFVGSANVSLRLLRAVAYAGLAAGLAYWILYPDHRIASLPSGAWLTTQCLALLAWAGVVRRLLSRTPPPAPPTNSSPPSS